jgi:hypothetical protein
MIKPTPSSPDVISSSVTTDVNCLSTPLATPTKRRKAPKFNVLRDKDGDRWYVPIPEDLQKALGGTKRTGATKAEAEEKARKLRLEYLTLFGTSGLPGDEPLAELCEKLLQKGEKRPLIQIVRDMITNQEAINGEPTIEEFRDRLVATLKDEGKRGGEGLIYFDLPWSGRRLSEFIDRQKFAKAVEEIKEFLANQRDFDTGKPWSETTKGHWVARFNRIINFAIASGPTQMTENPFSDKSFRYKKKGRKVRANLFPLDQLHAFLTYLRHIRPELYLGLVLGTWGVARVDEITRLIGSDFNLDPVGL